MSQQTHSLSKHSKPSSSAYRVARTSDEIDLRDLVHVLWRSKRTIIVTVVVVLALAFAYVFWSTPVYQTEAKSLPPSAAGLDDYNKAYRMSGPAVTDIVTGLNDAARDRLLNEAIPALSPNDAYEYFTRHLSSTALKRTFFESHYLPSRHADESMEATSPEQLWGQFNDQISMTVPGRSAQQGYATVSWTGTDAESIADWTNTYMQMAIEAAQDELATNLNSAVNTLYRSLDDQIASLRTGARKQREQRIVRLTEALRLAESIGLHKPSDAGNLITTYSGETAYMRGADALRNEIQLLKNRASDDPFIPELNGVLMRQALLETISVEPSDIAVARIDQAARVPVNPVKPRKALILALGLVLGGMLGVFIVLVQNMFRTDPGRS